VDINILALGVAYKGTALGLLWELLPKFGNSNQAERIALLKHLLCWLPAKRIKVVLADREFIGQDWFDFLMSHKLKFHIRLRENMLAELDEGDTRHLQVFFTDLKVGQRLTLHRRYRICGHCLAVTGMKLTDAELLIIVTNSNPKHSLAYYAQRWQIEMLFAALKTTGFDEEPLAAGSIRIVVTTITAYYALLKASLEATHLNQAQRVDTLLVLLMLALVWAHPIGEHLYDALKPIKRKKYGHLAQSFFRYDLDYLRSISLHLDLKFSRFCWALSLLSCT
jgi:hypothetical protein